MGWWSGTGRALADLILPAECAGCGAGGARRALCGACRDALLREATPVRPRGAPAELPVCLAAAVYDGPVREIILAYKERGVRVLAPVLGEALARVVLAGLGATPADWSLTLVPVPSTAAGIRARHGDHMLRLAVDAAGWLTRSGRRVAVRAPLRALPRQDSAGLDRQSRADAAWSAFAPRPNAGALLEGCDDGLVVVLDDVLTTGATVAAVARQLARAGAPVAFAATLAATRLRGVDTVAPFRYAQIEGWG